MINERFGEWIWYSTCHLRSQVVGAVSIKMFLSKKNIHILSIICYGLVLTQDKPTTGAEVIAYQILTSLKSSHQLLGTPFDSSALFSECRIYKNQSGLRNPPKNKSTIWDMCGVSVLGKYVAKT